MLKQPWISLFVGLLLVAAGCAPARPSNKASNGNGTAFPRVSQSSFVAASVSNLENSCGLLNTRDFASLFPTHTETILPKPQISHVTHPAFSSVDGQGMQTACVFYSFYLPGRRSGTVLQVNYWLDVPASASAASAWNGAWASAARGAQALAGVGDAAFYRDGRLNLKKGDVYVTLAATETKWSLGNPHDQQQQQGVEKQIAVDLLSRLR